MMVPENIASVRSQACDLTEAIFSGTIMNRNGPAIEKYLHRKTLKNIIDLKRKN